ncbi:hypothetical protein MKX01_035237, partial [Papaver californicum]
FSLSQNLYNESMDLTSATFSAAMTNLIPAITFSMDVVFKLETLSFRSLEGKLKVGGTLVVEISIWSTYFLYIEHHLRSVHGKQVLRLMLSVGSCISYSIWLIIHINWSEWKLGSNVRLFSVICSGVMASGVMMTLITWYVKVRGPLFSFVLFPVGLVPIALTGSALLNEKLHIGWYVVIGGVLIAIWLYFLLWGKAREMRRMSRLMPLTN